MLNLLPHQRLMQLLLALVAVFTLLGAVTLFGGIDLTTWALCTAGVALLLTVLDALSLLRLNRRLRFRITRQMPHYFIVGQKTEIVLSLRCDNLPSKQRLHLSLFDHLPQYFELEGDNDKQQVTHPAMPTDLLLSFGEYVTVRYRVKPLRRGEAVFTGTQIRLSSSMGLWQLSRFIALEEAVKTYPDFRRLDDNELQSDDAQSHGTLPHHRKRGSGTDFAELREYQDGDSLSHIDHKATSRMNKLMAKSFQIERDQQVMILLDCSRRLRIFQEDLSHFDYALNSAIFLARTILNQGDAVGLMTFGSVETRYSKPRKGRNSVNRLLNLVYDLEPSRSAPDYIRAAEQLMVRQKRRSLIIMITNLQEEDTDAIKTMLRILQKRHLVLIANLKEELLGEDIPIRNLDDAVFYAARETYHGYRQKMLRHIGNRQLILLDTYPTSLTAQLINLYLNVKQSGRF